MDEIQREQIANERFALIAPIVKLPKESLNPGQRYAILREIASGRYQGIVLYYHHAGTIGEGSKRGFKTKHGL